MKVQDQKNAAKSPINVQTTLIHVNPHFDEMVGYYVFRNYGEALFPGAAKACVQYAAHEVLGTDAIYDRDAVVPIGRGLGRFDDHELGDGVEECSATLVAKYLGVQDNPELKSLLTETLRFDLKPECPATRLPELIKVGHRNGIDQSLVFSYTYNMIEAIVWAVKYGTGPVKGEISLAKAYEMLVAENNSALSQDGRVRDRMKKLIGQSEAQNDSVTELAFAFKAMFRRGYAQADIMPTIRFWLHTMELDQIAFMETVAEVKTQRPVVIRALIDGKETRLRLMVCEGDNPHFQKAARYLGNDIVLVRQIAGNVQIHTNKAKEIGISLVDAVRMIRMLEIPEVKRKDVDWKVLGCIDEYPGVDRWFYFAKAEALFNGSLTVTKLPSRITTERLVDVLQHAFHPQGVATWCNSYRIRMNKPQAQVAKASQSAKSVPATTAAAVAVMS